MERVSGDYIKGYTKAVQDTIEVFEYIQPDLKYHRKNLNGKLSLMLLKAILKHREEIRERKEKISLINSGRFYFAENAKNNLYNLCETRKKIK